jgi:hypothetical protein
MAGNPTPRQMAKELLQGILPSRPLLMPIVFSLGARLENLSLGSFLSNPTKISNSLKLIRSYQPMDGVACYFNPNLEMEALGGAPEWGAEDQPPTIGWPDARKGELPPGLRSAEDAARSPQVQVAIEVIRRLKSLLRDEPVLMAGVAGPFTLAARLTQLDREGLCAEDFPVATLQMAASVITQISAALVAAGANLIFIQEEILPTLTPEGCEAWASLLAPTFNVARFYEALPVLQLANGRFFVENSDVIFNRQWDCVVCPPLEGLGSRWSASTVSLKSVLLGITLPPEALLPKGVGAEGHQLLPAVISDLRPVILTTTGDIRSIEDLKQLITILEKVPRTPQP